MSNELEARRKRREAYEKQRDRAADAMRRAAIEFRKLEEYAPKR